MLPDDEMIRVDVLNDTVEIHLGNTLNFDEAELALGLIPFIGFIIHFQETIWPAKHRSEVLTSLLENLWVASDEMTVVNLESDIVEFIKVGIDFHVI